MNRSHGGSVLYNSVLPWRGTGRIVVGDAYFASVATAQQLLTIDFKFIGSVKQCSRKFPMEHLAKQELGERGLFSSMVHRKDDGCVDMLSLVWRDRKRRYFVARTSDTQPGDPAVRTRLRETDDGAQHVNFTVAIPSVVQKQ